MKTWLAALLLSVTIGTAGADEPSALVRPDDSPLQVVRMAAHGSAADFSGHLSVSGTLVAQWPDGDHDPYSETPDVSLVPDAGSMARLPHFAGYEVHSLELRNARHALFMAFGATKANALLDESVKRLEATGTFEIADYSVSVECDTSWAQGSVVSARIPDARVVAIVDPIETC